MMRAVRWLFVGMLLMLVASRVTASAQIREESNSPFHDAWEHMDQPVAETRANRTWTWGPLQVSFTMVEEYAEAPGSERLVLYFDKARMELTYPGDDPQSIWYVTNGLLATELMTGQMQLGDGTFTDLEPALVAVAGDPDGSSSPTYLTLSRLRDAPPAIPGAVISQHLELDGTTRNRPALAEYGVTAAYRVTVPGIDHQIASVFWSFMNSEGLVYQDGEYISATLFANPFVAIGYPLTEAYWITVEVGGQPENVLIQCFERRCLTYTPGNPEAWQVESGNVGQHYFQWRYNKSLTDSLTSLPFTTVVEGAAPGGEIPEPFLRVVTNTEQRAELAGLLSTADLPALEQVDLSRHIVIAAFLGLKPTSGYSIDIIAVAARDDLLEVVVRDRSPAPGEPVRQGFETPYHLVQVDRNVLNLGYVSRYQVVDASGVVHAAGPIDSGQ